MNQFSKSSRVYERVGQDRLPFGPVLAPPRPFQPPRNPPRTRQLFTVHPRTKHPGGQPPNLLEPRHILRAPRGVLARVTTSPYLGAACSGSPACPRTAQEGSRVTRPVVRAFQCRRAGGCRRLAAPAPPGSLTPVRRAAPRRKWPCGHPPWWCSCSWYRGFSKPRL